MNNNTSMKAGVTHITAIHSEAGDEWIGPHFVVTTTVTGLPDAPTEEFNLTGFAVKTERLATRLAAAIEAGAVFYDHFVGVTTGGQDYAHATSRVMAKYANADLKRLGF